MKKRNVLTVLLTCTAMHAAAIDYSSVRLFWGNQPGQFATGGTDVTLANDAFYTFQTGFTFHSELCEEGSCSVPTPGNSPIGLRLTNTLVTCQNGPCGGWNLSFIAFGTLNTAVSVSLSMDNAIWNTANPVHGLVAIAASHIQGQVFTPESGTSLLVFDSSSPNAGPSGFQTWSNLGPVEIDGSIQFVFPQGYVALSSGDTFQMLDSLVMTVTPLDSGPPATAPEPATWVLIAVGLAFSLSKRAKLATATPSSEERRVSSPHQPARHR